jgi:DNA mismatch endonuclease (patch repair protein)
MSQSALRAVPRRPSGAYGIRLPDPRLLRRGERGATATMKANRQKDTGPELVLRRLLWQSDARGYRLHRAVRGRPDISYGRQHLAVFVHGCFWHGCPKCQKTIPKTNTAFWSAKFELNRRRDAMNVKELRSNGWSVITIWECELQSDARGCVARVLRELQVLEGRL